MAGITIVEDFRLRVRRVVHQYWPLATQLRDYMECVVRPRLGSYAAFLDLINSLPNEHSLRSDVITIEILEDYRQLVELFEKAEKYLERHK